MGLPPGTNASELSSKVKNRELAEVLDSVQGSSYMPGNTETDTNEIKKKICRVLKKSVFLFIFAFFPLYSGAAQKDMPLLKNSREALNAYDRGEFKKTAEYYKSRINPSAPSPALVYNLGNCYCQEGDYAKALVCYERALRLAPNDSDIFENLNFVRRKLFLPEITAPRNPAELLVSIRRHLRPDQWILIAGAFWMICWFTLIFRRKLSGGKLILLLSAGFIGMVLCITTAASQYASTYSAENAIITERGVKVYSLPSENSETTGVKLKNGEQVKIVEQRLDWARIRDGQAEGWIHSEELARIWGEFKAFRGEKKKYK
jgi:tetratricopeptide (TPR) repeat protein